MGGSKKFGAFNGVFIPTFLSIIGVILYLRLGYIVGAAGVLGSIMIILLAVSITLATAFSLSSITTNIKIGPGGAYSIISKTLGLEVGGSVGIPLYLAQIFSIALYVFGFSEVWRFMFPEHKLWIILAVIFAALLIINLISASLAISFQAVVFLVVIISLFSIFAGGSWFSSALPAQLTGSFPETSFWVLFALFFPAVTGLAAGIGLSGDLSDPKKQIRKGIMTGWLVTTGIYIAMVFWLGSSASQFALTTDNMIVTKLASYAPIVLFGVLAATFSSALTAFVAAPRLLYGMAVNSIMPGSKFLAKKAGGEPRNAVIITSILVAGSLFTGGLNEVAPVLTMFFLITYSALNIVVFIEQSLGLPSFRPTFRIPKVIPLYGAIGSVSVMFLINPLAGGIALVFLVLVYLALVRRKLISKEGDVRSGLFIMLSEWAAKRVIKLPESTTHIWKPNVLLPVVTTATLRGNFPLIRSLAFPNGTMTVLGLNLIRTESNPEEVKMTRKQTEKEMKELKELVSKFGEENIFTSFSTVSVKDYTNGICVSLEAIEGQVFNPNILFLPFKPAQLKLTALRRIYTTSQKHNTGVIVFDRDEDVGLGSETDIHVWLPGSVLRKDFYDDRIFDLAMLIAYTLSRNWNVKITLWMSTSSRKKDEGRKYLKELIYESRLPASTEIKVVTKNFENAVAEAPHGDIHIVPIRGEPEIELMLEISKLKGKSFLFVTDSGNEDILA